jgi:hypothetical protein
MTSDNSARPAITFILALSIGAQPNVCTRFRYLSNLGISFLSILKTSLKSIVFSLRPARQVICSTFTFLWAVYISLLS